MLYSDLGFLIFFLPLAVGGYYLTPKNHRNITLLALSLVFYFLLEPYFAVILISLSVLNYLYSVFSEKLSDSKKARLALYIAAVCFNLAFLVGFRYVPLMTNVFIAPVGVTFFVLNSLSYITDVFKETDKKAKNIVSYGLYASFFPTILGGPILRYHEISAQLEFRTENHQRTAEGISQYIRGLSKKVILSESLFLVFSEIKSMGFESLPTLSAWLCALSFGLAALFELWGFSDMGTGLAKIFGFNLPQNFNAPLSAKSVSAFAERFNVSLNRFLTDYFYLPLAKKRGFALSLLLSLSVGVLSALFYGADLSLLIFGLYIGLLVIVERGLLFKIRKKLPSALSFILTFLFISLGVPFFALPLGSSFALLKSMLHIKTELFFDDRGVYLLLTNLLLIAVSIFCGTKAPKKISKALFKKAPAFFGLSNYIYSLLLLFVSLCFMVARSGGSSMILKL